MLAKSFFDTNLYEETVKITLLFLYSFAYTFLKGWCIKLKIIVHYPETKEDAEILKKKVAQVHAESVTRYISNLNCNVDEKMELVNEVEGSIQNF